VTLVDRRPSASSDLSIEVRSTTTRLSLFSPSQLNAFLECEHLTQLAQAAEKAGGRKVRSRDPHTDLLARKGDEHEQAWLQRLQANGRAVHSVQRLKGEPDWEAAAKQTLAAMREGVEVIYQGVLLDRDWRGVADFLIRVDTPSDLGPWSYEVWDTKLARHGKPYFALQLSFYSERLAQLQGWEPESMHVVLGTREQLSLRCADYAAYYRTVKRRFLRAVAEGRDTYPYPVPHCALCEFREECEERREADDDLCLIAGIRREQAARLQESGITTVAALAAAGPDLRVRIGEPALLSLRHQAALQTQYRITGVHALELIPPGSDPGFALLPEPTDDDLFFDMEGYPYFEPADGLEYLFGVLWLEQRRPEFLAYWGTDRHAERKAFEAFIDLALARLERNPGLHIYHYAHYEPTQLKRLMCLHQTREEELDHLLRRRVFVDLYKVVRQTLRISHQSYSLKAVRTFFMETGAGSVTDAEDSIIGFESWLQTGDQAILDAIERYNEEDCLSTLRLRDWLLERKTDAERQFRCVIPWRETFTALPEEERPDAGLQRTRAQQLLDASTGDPVTSGADRAGRELLAHVLDYHRREAKPGWWAYYNRREASSQELLDDTLALAGLQPTALPVDTDKRSLIHTLRFPPQECKLGSGDGIEDPRTGIAAGTVTSIDVGQGLVALRRGPTLAAVALPDAIIAGGPLNTRAQRAALGRLADNAITLGPTASGRYRALRDLLLREPPHVAGRARGLSLQTTDLVAQTELIAALDDSYLFVQGPPGSGKTWTGARLIVALLAAGRRVGVAANSHQAIHNLLDEVERVAVVDHVTFRGLKKASRDESEYHGRFIASTQDNKDCERAGAEIQLIAGTSWLFARPAMDGGLDYLFIDEAGQVSLADALAMGTAARNLVLLGDPQQLAQVSQGVHPGGSGCSVLEHLLGEAATVSADRGLFLPQTWRMHPDVCRFISEMFYDGRLQSAPGCERQRLDSDGLSGTGLWYVPVEHRGNGQQSVEESDAVAREVRRLLQSGRVTNSEGASRVIKPTDILVVAPYNMQVRCLREALPDGVEVGTVDKFQGREAPVVFFSMASSSGDDLPRSIDFLFSRNRLNVAISRARCAAVLVGSPTLLETRCRTLEQMRLVNGLCRFVELAHAVL
jgi:predicted RecB family nuclease